jgi:hypothetical protein
MTTRVLSPATARSPFALNNGQTVAQVPGTYQDVSDSQADQLCANGWLRVGLVGTTSQRPSSSLAAGLGAGVAQAGTHFFDTTIGALILHDGTTWRNPATGASV